MDDRSCEFCRESRPIVYCKADAARLCLACDARIHSANALFKRHLRALLCENCGAHPSSIHCLDHRLFACRGCDRKLHSYSKDAPQHHKKMMNSYGGCPSAKEFAVLWGYDLNELGNSGSHTLVPSSSSSSYGSVIPETTTSIGVVDPGLLPDNLQSTAPYESQTKLTHHDTLYILKQIIALERLQCTEKSNSSSMIRGQVKDDVFLSKASMLGSETDDIDQTHLHPQAQGISVDVQQDSLDHELQYFPSPFYQLENLNSSSSGGIPLHGDPFWRCTSPEQSSELWPQTMQDLGICGQNSCDDGPKIPEVDLTFQNFDELFGGDQVQNRSFFDDIAPASMLEEKDASPNKLDSNNSKSTKDILISASDYAHCTFPGNVDDLHSLQLASSCLSLSASRISAETSFSDYLDTGDSPSCTMKDEPPCVSADAESGHSEARENAMRRYKKKKDRLYEKRIRYASRKAGADVRKSVKDRFVKAGGYESDSINVTKSY